MLNAPTTYYADNDHDSFGNPNNTTAACSLTPPSGYVSSDADCDDTKLLYADNDGDGFGSGSAIACGVADNTDCNDADAGIHAPIQYYVDADHDGYGSPAIAMLCVSIPPAGYSTNNTDCNDNEPQANPGATEICGNNIDDNCDGQIDEGCGIACNLSVNAGSDESTFYGYSGDQTVIRTAIVQGGIAPYTYSWTMNRSLLCNMINAAGDESFSGGTCSNTQCPANGSPASPPVCIGSSTVTAKLIDTANVCLTVTDANGCKVTDCFVVKAEDARCFPGNNNISKVKVCHRTGSEKNPWVQICVADDAVPALLPMGDYVGTCSSTSSTNIVAIENPSTPFNSRVSPNPAHEKVKLEFESHKNEKYIIQILDDLGKVLIQKDILAIKGTNEYYVSLNRLIRGIYIIRLHNGTSVQMQKLIVN